MVVVPGGEGGGVEFGLLVRAEKARSDEAFVKQAATSGFVGGRGGEGLGDVAGVGDSEPDRHGCGF